MMVRMNRISFTEGHGDWIPEKVWKRIRRSLPIPCVDIIVENDEGAIFLGWRIIEPYVNVWALPGGRVLRGERLEDSAKRILAKNDLRARDLHLVGIFPIRFATRSDFSVCLAGTFSGGNPRSDGHEFARVKWAKRLPSNIGRNYTRMIHKWRQLKQLPQALLFTRL